MQTVQSNLARLAQSVSPFFIDLVCGCSMEEASHTDGDYIGLFRRLRKDVESLHFQIALIIDNQQQISASAVFPFLCRKLLEVSLTSILARIDPMRVLAARKHQQRESYEQGKQNASSISWTGDILPSEKPPINDIWDVANLKKGTERSLLGWHIGAVALSPGLCWVVDNSQTSSEWITKLSTIENPFAWIKGTLAQLYSALSKGVHAEYLLDDEIAFDDISRRQHVHDSYMLICLLSAATHATPFFARALQPETALQHLTEIEKIFQ